ncbi:amino acid adenylation domain-containing protein [Streptomyces sp. NBC_01283]|uniref:amino acid adenylation domain-containing protein n=1 Tax=Streptomyces sp. NBC_01283 TaxID=2903812 RepID=UPI00352FC1C6|nr:amino acid adenylation domain-containing protein [Streptomyces sp. NBC_01283]WSL21401.1 amino acid adenylation domain-containing protein [Streptomyces sp. NBC_01283]
MSDPRGSSADVPFAGTGVPPATFTELFEARVREVPQNPAVECAGTVWTYRELNASANRFAHWLIGRGIGPEQTVALAMPRSVEQIAALLGIMKAGAAYLPWDLGHPEKRIAYMAADAAPTAVLTTRAAAVRLPAGLEADVLVVDAPDTAAARRGAPESDPVDSGRVGPLSVANAAYVIYTSGSTGRPKGVTVTHSGLAALRAEAMRVGELGDCAGARVLQYAALSFDMSVWDLVTALTTGALLVLPAQEQLVGEELAALLAEREVTHATLPPSVLATLPAGTAASLDQLRVMVVGGEASTPALVAEWGAARRLFNAYGPTEATVWATFGGPLRDGAVPIGTAMTDARAYLLGEDLTPVAEGQAGDLYLAGPGLARGYLGRPAQTATRFLADPLGPAGGRMYRTGDVARIGADGQLEYLGRSDDQVKLRGQRIELGEVETALATHPRVRQAAVVVQDTGTGGKQLVGFVVPASDTGTQRAEPVGGAGQLTLGPGLGAAELRAFLARRLPEGMVPGKIMVIDEMPLTPNGKADKAALPRPQSRGADYRAPRSPVEEALADAFAEVLCLARVGIDDDFLSLGGDSIQAMRVASQIRARGVEVSFRQIFESRTVAALADAIGVAEPDPATELADGGAGRLLHLPATHLLHELGPGAARYCQAILLNLSQGLDRTTLAATLAALIDHHDMLRARVTESDGGGLVVAPPGSVTADPLIHRVAADAPWEAAAGTERAEEWNRLLRTELEAAAARLDPAAGPVAQFTWFDAGSRGAGRLLMVLHHLLVDAHSWRILLADLRTAGEQLRTGLDVELPPVTAPLQSVARALTEEAHRPARVAELDAWLAGVDGPDPAVGARRRNPADGADPAPVGARILLPASVTDTLLAALPAAFRCGVEDALLTALALALANRRAASGADASSVLIRLDEYGRAAAEVAGVELSRTVGRLTGSTPVRLDVTGVDLEEAFAGGSAAGTAVKAVKEQLRALPDQGIGYRLLRHLNPRTAAVLERSASGRISFAHLGRFPAPATDLPGAGFTPAEGWTVPAAPDAGADVDLAVRTALVDTGEGPCLEAVFTGSGAVLTAAEVQELADLWGLALDAISRHAVRTGAGGLTPSDVLLPGVTQQELDDWQQHYPGLSDVWPLAPLPQGLLVHSLMEHETSAEVDTYQVQYTLRLSGPVDPAHLRAAAQALVDRHPGLRAGYAPGPDGTLVQFVVDGVELPWQYLDLSSLGEAMRDSAYRQFLSSDLTVHFDLAVPPVLRMSLLTLAEDRHVLILSAHHATLDGWCLPLLAQDLMRLYADQGAAALPPAPSYRDYLAWLDRQDTQAAARAWAQELAGLTEPSLLTAGTAPAGSAGGTDRVDVPLPAAAALALPDRAADIGVTLNTLVQGAWAVVLSHLTNRQDVVFGAAVAGRPAELPDADRMVGTFINTVPVRVRCDPQETAAQLLEQLQQRQGTLLGRPPCGLGEIQSAAGLPTLFDTVIGFESFPLDREAAAEAAEAAGFAVTGIGLHSLSHFPMTVFAHPDGDRLRLTMQYQRQLLDQEYAQRVAALYGRVLERLAADVRALLGDLVVEEPAGELKADGDAGLSVRSRVLDPLLGERVRSCAKKLGTDPAALFHAGWALAVSMFSGRADVCFRSTAAGETRPVQVELTGMSVRDLVHRMDRELPGFGHRAHPRRFDMILDFRGPHANGSAADDGRAEPVEVAISGRHGRFTVQGRAGLPYDPQSVIDYLETALARLADALHGDRAAQHPALELPVLGDEVRRQVLAERSEAPAAQAPGRCVHEWFEEVAAATPDAVAVTAEGRSLSYRNLNARANRLARHLRGLGVGPEVLVALRLDRTEHLVVAVLAVLKAGGAYVPIDPASPADRTALVLRDSAPRLLLTDAPSDPDQAPGVPPIPVVDVRADTDRWSGLSAEDLPDTGVRPAHAAYVIYTSGSTGTPKGVKVEHRNVVRLFTTTREHFGFDEQDVWALLHSFAFDFSVWEMWGALLHGGTLVVVPREVARNPKDLYRLLCTSRVTVLNQTPTAFHQLIAAQGEDGAEHALRVVVFGGEALNPALLTPWMRREANRDTRLVNMYGITETTVHTTHHLLTGADADRVVSPVGRRLPDLHTYVLDRYLRPTPVGVVGELYVGGAGVARGYLNRPALSAQRFLADPFAGKPGARMYRSGDLVRWLPDKTLEYLGRNDDQVKVRGFRIELGEIEARLTEHPAVQDARVVVRDHGDGDKRVVAYVVPAADRAPAVRELLRLERAEGDTHPPVRELPNGMTVFHHNKSETDFVYEEIFTREEYLRGGITIDNGDTIVDVGANIGLFTLFASNRNPDGRLYAFEPLPPLHDSLRRNVELHGLNAKLFDCGLGAQAQEETFTFYPHNTVNSTRAATAPEARDLVRAFLRNKAKPADGARPGAAAKDLIDEVVESRLESRTFTCRVRTFSEIIEQEAIDRIDLMKIDVEGAEHEVLKGIRPEHWPRIRQFAIELHDVDGRLAEVETLLKDHGFEVVCEQDSSLLHNTVLCNVYARRDDGRSADPGPRAPVAPAQRRWSGRADLLDDVRNSLQEVLPTYMLPSAYTLLEALPLNQNGKLDQDALPEPGRPRRDFTPPRSRAEQELCVLMADVLHIDQVGVGDNFFDLGGDSLLASGLTGRIGRKLGVRVLINEVYGAPDVAALARIVDNAPKVRSPRLRRRGTGDGS